MEEDATTSLRKRRKKIRNEVRGYGKGGVSTMEMFELGTSLHQPIEDKRKFKSMNNKTKRRYKRRKGK